MFVSIDGITVYKHVSEIPLDDVMKGLKPGFTLEAWKDNVETLMRIGYDEMEARLRATRYAGMSEAIAPSIPIPKPVPLEDGQNSTPLTLVGV